MGRFLSRHPWLIPLVFAVAFAASGYSTLRALEEHKRARIRSQSEATVAVAVQSLEVWAETNQSLASVFSRHPVVRRAVAELTRIARTRGRPVAPALEAIVLRCLEKQPEDRYPDAGALFEALESAEVEGSWGQAEARAWWEDWQAAHGAELEGSGSGSGSTPSGYSIDLLGRMTGSQRSD